MTPPLPPALGGERVLFDSPAGRLCAYVDGSGPPLLLVHSVNAAASAAEVRPLYDHHRATRTVFALELPGYGGSDRTDRAYTPRLMTDAVHAAVDQLRLRCGSAPVDALAVSLSCEFLARAATETPGPFRSLALVSPTGLRGLKRWHGAPGSTRGKPWLARALRGPGDAWGGALFRALTRPAVIRHFLRRTWGGREIDETLWAYDVLTARQPGAEHAPLAFLSGALFSADIHHVYERLERPLWLSHGVRGDFTDYRGRCYFEGRPNWRFSVFQTGAMPYFERPAAFCAAYDTFLASPRG
jgi:pimeloyl-ACP methyl ester carboxylesterase